MEKFGIFELLDALSALTAPDAEKPSDEPTRPQTSDPVCRPPSYGQIPPEQPSPQKDGALSSFLARHDEIAGRVDKKP